MFGQPVTYRQRGLKCLLLHCFISVSQLSRFLTSQRREISVLGCSSLRVEYQRGKGKPCEYAEPAFLSHRRVSPSPSRQYKAGHSSLPLRHTHLLRHRVSQRFWSRRLLVSGDLKSPVFDKNGSF